ncbi:CCA tRNA nucleotidyltransferase [Treponema sp. HNW]|uniref:CCA tRNA nucleotidyltransferase n=1 Tax=Treponema sp. HNW TaxID=3116654 RepID=UPI003D1289CC
MIKSISVPPVLQKINRIFSDAGFEAWLVGGAVRDIVRGKKASDWDIATDAQPEQVCALFKRVIPTGIEHGTVTVIFTGHHIEVTTFRTEKGYSDGRHPDAVQYVSGIEEDLARRDFTMNAIAVSLKDGHIFDPFDGKKDIKSKNIRCVGEPSQRFNEDGLRPVRAIRFASTLNFTIEEKTLGAISGAREKIAGVSLERFRDEFIKILLSEKPSYGLSLLEQTGILSIFIPELASCRGVNQADGRGHHRFDVLDHLFYACDHALSRSQKEDNLLTIRLAALFHDIGKPPVKNEVTKNNIDCITFYSHEKEGAALCTRILERLRFPSKTVRYVSFLVLHHMFHYESSWTDAAVRRFMARITPPAGLGNLEQALSDLFDLRIADASGMTNSAPILHTGTWSADLLELKERIDKESAQKNAIGLKDLALSGRDLIEAGIPSGRGLGLLLEELLQTVLDDPACNTKEKLLEIAVNKGVKQGEPCSTLQ